MKTPLETRGSRANDGKSARLGKKQPDGTHGHRIAHVPRIRPVPGGVRCRSLRASAIVARPPVLWPSRRRRIAGKGRHYVRKFMRARISACLVIPLDQRPESPYSY